MKKISQLVLKTIEIRFKLLEDNSFKTGLPFLYLYGLEFMAMLADFSLIGIFLSLVAFIHGARICSSSVQQDGIPRFYLHNMSSPEGCHSLSPACLCCALLCLPVAAGKSAPAGFPRQNSGASYPGRWIGIGASWTCLGSPDRFQSAGPCPASLRTGSTTCYLFILKFFI